MGWVLKVTPRPLCPRERDSVPILEEAVLASEPAWMGAENLAPAGFRTQNCQPKASRTDEEGGEISRRLKGHFLNRS